MAVVDHGSISAASLVLRVSQPALSKAIRKLEADVGAKILARATDGSISTPAGAAFYRRAQRFLAQVAGAVQDVRGALRGSGSDSVVLHITSSHIRSVIAIWQAGSFRAAARQLGIAEATLHRPARAFEAVLGVGLYRRTPEGLAVNRAGADLARALIVALNEIRAGIEEAGSALEPGAIAVGVLALAPRGALVRAAGAVLAHHPSHRIHVVEGDYGTLSDRLRAGGIDLVFGAVRADAHDGLARVPMFEDPYVLVGRAGHPLAGARHGARALQRYGWVFPSKGLPRRELLDRMLATLSIKPAVQIETSCLQTIAATLRQTDHLTILSRSQTQGGPELGLVEIGPVPVAHEPRLVGLTHRANWLPTPAQTVFMDALTRETAG